MTSKRNYLTIAELSQYADITVTDTDEALDQISQAEEDVDSFVGPQDKAVKSEYLGRMSAVSGNTFTLEQTHQNQFYDDYFTWCVVEIVGGTGAGQLKRITGSTYAGVLTVEGWDTTPDTSSVYKIYQLSKFPTCDEVYVDTNNSPAKYYKNILDQVRRAVAAQVEYRIQMGTAFFAGDKAHLTGERIGDYSYTKTQTSISNLIAPKAKAYLRGIINRKGVIMY